MANRKPLLPNIPAPIMEFKYEYVANNCRDLRTFLEDLNVINSNGHSLIANDSHQSVHMDVRMPGSTDCENQWARFNNYEQINPNGNMESGNVRQEVRINADYTSAHRCHTKIVHASRANVNGNSSIPSITQSYQHTAKVCNAKGSSMEERCLNSATLTNGAHLGAFQAKIEENITGEGEDTNFKNVLEDGSALRVDRTVSMDSAPAFKPHIRVTLNNAVAAENHIKRLSMLYSVDENGREHVVYADEGQQAGGHVVEEEEEEEKDEGYEAASSVDE